MGAAAPSSAMNMAGTAPYGREGQQGSPGILEMLATVLVQDSLLLAELYPRNRVHAHLLRNEEFRAMLVVYKEGMATGVSLQSWQRPAPTYNRPYNI